MTPLGSNPMPPSTSMAYGSPSPTRRSPSLGVAFGARPPRVLANRRGLPPQFDGEPRVETPVARDRRPVARRGSGDRRGAEPLRGPPRPGRGAGPAQPARVRAEA